jgi:hypothetical protein
MDHPPPKAVGGMFKNIIAIFSYLYKFAQMRLIVRVEFVIG